MRAALAVFGLTLSLMLGGCVSSDDAATANMPGDGGAGANADDNDAGGDDTSGGQTGAAGSGPLYVPPKCHQACQDYLTGYAVSTTVWFIYNQNVPGLPGGSVDLNVACPLGGTAHITGTANGTTDGTSTVHLVFELAACRNTDKRFSLTFDGTVTMDGNFNNGSTGAAEFTAVVFASSDLGFKGGITYLDDPQVDDSCALAASQDGTELQGQVCDREFNEEKAFGAFTSAADGGTAGAGTGGAGTGASGGGDTDCTCYCGWPAGQQCTTNAECPADTSVPGTSVPGVCGCPVGCKGG